MSRSLKDTVLESPLVYRLWQASWARAKLEPVFQHNDLSTVRRALNLGCGPGTNTSHFAHCDYLGLDINPAYVAHARAATRASPSPRTCARSPFRAKSASTSSS